MTLYQPVWSDPGPDRAVAIDPTRMVQGITGIGFLGAGAGVIVKEGLSVRGLTTAASIWITAAIGVLIGVGMWVAAGAATLITLGTLSLFRHIELHMPMSQFAAHMVRFSRATMPCPSPRCALLAQHSLSLWNLSYRLVDDGKCFEYRNARHLRRRASRPAGAHADGAAEGARIPHLADR